MGGDIIGREPAADAIVEQASDWLGYNVAEVCLEGSGRKHVPSRQESQVIYVVSCAYAAVLEGRGWTPESVVGHSLGSWAAAAACGVYDVATGLALLTEVERLLEQFADGTGQAMGVIIGLEASELRSLVSPRPDVWVANWNSPKQQVIAGSESAVEAILATARDRGVKQARRLPTTRAMHTPLLIPVAQAMRAEFERTALHPPKVPFVSTRDGRHLRTAGEVSEFLCDALVQPVEWQATIEELLRAPETSFLDVGPGSVLAGMLPFIDPAAPIQSAAELLDQQVVA